ncbi:MAG: hypothetical protein JWR89_2782 [Tardiphaga sp.]|uniref:DUF3050 domain-containing protein n=1 Tax=Tardiphaga sp. TaxID=1926292 RepID=UPI0026388786|nr:DUF3050 domain-containing protein [Tardiphaga sp.]MDB5502880.1 hypothetical protein [Tardiphaga sp.]
MLQDATPPQAETELDRLDELRQSLLRHPIYAEVNSIARLKLFMEDHVFAVWDFMSLLKRLQRDVTCLDVPWFPAADPHAARLINEIVIGEESDLGPDGTSPISHLELYVGAMQEIGARTDKFRQFCKLAQDGIPIPHCLQQVDAPPHVRVFVEHTMALASRGTTEQVLGGFLYGREDVIPDMFQSIRNGFWASQAEIPKHFDYYVLRHIELDGDSHGPLGKELLARVIGGSPDKARRAYQSAADSIEHRIGLWSGTLRGIRSA